MVKKKVLVLFSKLSDYMLNVFESYVTEYTNVELHIVKKKPDEKEAPFSFNLDIPGLFFYNQNDFNQSSLLEMVNHINPKLIICSGWSNKPYNHVIHKNYTKVDCILTMDNQFHGTAKQYVGLLYSRLFIIKKYKAIWVPGEPQKQYAIKLGFKVSQIFKGWYVANQKNFLKPYKTEKIHKKFVFVGRFIQIKGILDLCNSFIAMHENQPNDWELHFIGAGPLKDQITKHAKIRNLGFLQPAELKTYCKEVGVFVLPSFFEPWGLVVQEFALAGFPMIVSDKVGAASQFVSNSNGYIFESKNYQSLKSALEYFIKKSNEELLLMSQKSTQLGLSVSEKAWADTLNKFIR